MDYMQWPKRVVVTTAIPSDLFCRPRADDIQLGVRQDVFLLLVSHKMFDSLRPRFVHVAQYFLSLA